MNKRGIEVIDLSFAYGEHKVLSKVNLSASPGELLCVLGRNGAGKSTLFKCMLGILKGYSGKVLIEGRDISSMKAAERARCVAYIPQAANPAFSYSVRDMVLMGTTASLSGRISPGIKERSEAEAALVKLGIEYLADRNYSRISGGEQQLVLIARAIAQGAGVLVMDEPTSSLDYGNQMRVQHMLKQLTNDGYTIIQSSHDPEKTFMFANRVACIRDGSIYRDGAPADILDEQLIRDLYGIDVETISSDDNKSRFFILKENEKKL